MSDVHYMLKDLPLRVQMDETGVRSPGHEGAGVVGKSMGKRLSTRS